MAEHNTLTGASLHEPKGVAAAAANTVYVADGATSGSHQQVSPSNCVLVHSASDLPAAVAGVRTLADNTIYSFSGSVSIGSDRIVLGAQTTIQGLSPFLDGIVSTTSGALLTSAGNFFIASMFVTCSSGAVFDLNGTGTQITFISQLRVVSCDTIGNVDDYGVFTAVDVLVQAAASGGLTFAGALGNVRISQGTYNTATGIVFDLGVSTADGFVFSGVNIDNASGVTGIDIAPAGANINSGGQGIIDNCTFKTSATATAGYSAGDNKWTVSGSVGVPRSIALAQGHIVDSALATTFSGTGGGNEELVNFGTAFNADSPLRFTISTAGRFTYTGDVDVVVQVSSSIYSLIAGGASRTYNYYIGKNGTIIASSVSQQDYDGTNFNSVSCGSLVTLITGDFIELFARAETATTSLTVDTCSLKVVQVSP
jgi:hypothetical protein